MPEVIGASQSELSRSISLLGGTPIPPRRVLVALGDSYPFAVHHAQKELSQGMPLFGKRLPFSQGSRVIPLERRVIGALIPHCRCLVALSNPFSVSVHSAQKILGLDIPLLGKRLPFLQSSRVIPLTVRIISFPKISAPRRVRRQQRQRKHKGENQGREPHDGQYSRKHKSIQHH